MSQPPNTPDRPVVAAGKLWAGGFATAAVAALIAVAGVLICRGIFDVPILEPEGDGVWGDANAWWYAAVAALVALVATALVHGLLLATPRPLSFFGWIIALATVIAVLAPFASGASIESKVATGAINLALGAAIGSLLSGVARSATTRARPPAPGPPPSYPG